MFFCCWYQIWHVGWYLEIEILMKLFESSQVQEIIVIYCDYIHPICSLKNLADFQVRTRTRIFYCLWSLLLSLRLVMESVLKMLGCSILLSLGVIAQLACSSKAVWEVPASRLAYTSHGATAYKSFGAWFAYINKTWGDLPDLSNNQGTHIITFFFPEIWSCL